MLLTYKIKDMRIMLNKLRTKNVNVNLYKYQKKDVLTID